MNTQNQANKFVTVATFNKLDGAEVLKDYLVREGLEARVQDETNLQRFWFMATPKAGIHVQVQRQHFELAEAILRQPQTLPLLQAALRCPSCKSLRVEYPDLTRKNILPTLLAQLFVALGMTKHKYYCEECHYAWLQTPQQIASGKRTQRIVPATTSILD